MAATETGVAGGVSFALTPEQKELRALAREFAANEIRPVAAEHDEKQLHADEIVRKAHALGLLNLHLPESIGGPELSCFDGMLVGEELNWGCTGIGTTLSSNGLSAGPILIAGTEEQKRTWLGPLVEEPILGCFGLTEPGAGSDVSGIQTTAERRGDEYVLNGSKMFITNAGHAAWMVCFASTDRSKGHRGLSAFVVPMATDGVTIEKKLDKMGQRATDTSAVAFQDVVDQAKKLKAFGLDPLNGSLQALIDQNAAVGGSQQDLEGKVLALGQAWAKQKLQGEEILQLVERGVPVWSLLEKATGLNVTQLRKLSEQGKLGRDTIKALYEEIGKAIVQAQQFDTEAGFRLETPDELTDLASFADALLAHDFRAHPGVHRSAKALKDALVGIKVYGSPQEQPWVAAGTNITWDFSADALAMNIFLPDPLLRGLWDWRSPYYLDINPDPNKPRVQPHIIDFVKVTDWVDFIIEYHKESQEPVRLLPARIPQFPVFNASFDPKQYPPAPPCGRGKPGGGATAA